MKHSFLFPVLGLVLSHASFVPAQTCRRVADINTERGNASSSPSGSRNDSTAFVKCNGEAYFLATTCQHGRELWKTNGTAAGTVMVADILPGPGSGIGSHIRTTHLSCKRIGNKDIVFFVADDGTHGAELWRTEGTAATTRMVKDINPGIASSFPAENVLSNGRIYFLADDSAASTPHGVELWTSDGTAAGTSLVRDIRPGVASSRPRGLIGNSARREAYFSADDGARGRELWKIDQSGNASLVRDLAPGAPSGLLTATRFVNHLGATLFAATTTSGGFDHELWRTLGTAATTFRIKDINLGSGSSMNTLEHARAIGNELFFPAYDGASGIELWKTTGTASGTVRVADINPGRLGSFPEHLHRVAGTTLYFAAYGPSGQELYKYVSGRVSLVKDIYAGTGGGGPTGFQAFGTSVLFSARDTSNGRELWLSNGSASGTVMLRNIAPGTASSNPEWITNLGGSVVFCADDGKAGRELWITRGTSVSTLLLKDIEPSSATSSSSPRNLTSCWGNTLAFSASTGTAGEEPYVYTRAGGAISLGDLEPGAVSSKPAEFVCCGGKIFFVAESRTTGRELVVSDGTWANTRFIDLIPGSDGSNPRELTCCDNKLFFAAADQTLGGELWVLDPVTGVAKVVKDLRPGTAGSVPGDLTCCKDRIFFSAYTDATGRELYASDGTADGTQLVKDIYPGRLGSSPRGLLCCPDPLDPSKPRIFFAALTATHGAELWKSDGTAAGTELVADIWVGSNSSSPVLQTCCEGKVYFSASHDTSGIELWVSDGTTSGTVLLADLRPGRSPSWPTQAVCCDGRVFFVANDGVTGQELYTTLGSPASTRLVVDLFPGTNGSVPLRLRSVGNRVYFSARSSLSRGHELFVSDGTAAGTRMVCETAPGPDSGNPASLATCGGSLYLAASDSCGDNELYALACPGGVVERLGTGCGGATLDATPPAIGKTATLRGECPPANHVGVVLLAPASPRPLHVPGVMAPGCWGWTLGAILIYGVVPPSNATWRLPLPIPNVPGLRCRSAVLQTWYLELSQPIRMSNGVRLTFG